MGRLIEIHDIDEFSEVKTIPDATINNEILTNIRNLDEKKELERFLREILYDPNETPHGPTEIADILTNVHVRGDRSVSASVPPCLSASRSILAIALFRISFCGTLSAFFLMSS